MLDFARLCFERGGKRRGIGALTSLFILRAAEKKKSEGAFHFYAGREKEGEKKSDLASANRMMRSRERGGGKKRGKKGVAWESAAC